MDGIRDRENDISSGLASLERPGELRRCRLSRLLITAYAMLPARAKHSACRRCMAWEGGPFFTGTVRDLLSVHHGVHVGAYSYGPFLEPGAFPSGVRVGRYVSCAFGVRVVLHNHPTDRLSMHPIFYDAQRGFVHGDHVEHGTLEIGHDAWIGTNAIILAGCKRIGIGAIIGAGAVVTKDIPDFAVAVGVPARIIRYRFDAATQELVIRSRWWERTVQECVAVMPSMIAPLGNSAQIHPLLRLAQ